MDLSIKDVRNLPPESFPLRGWRLFRWTLALRIYRIGCQVSGRHVRLLRWNADWREYYCPHCGWIVDV